MNAVSIVARARGGHTVITSLSGTEPWRPRILDGRSGWARVALVQSRATLIRGDDITLSIDVGAGAALEVVELGALLAHDVRAGAEARLSVALSLAPDARVVWLGLPLVLAAGCAVHTSFLAELGRGARMLRGESVVLGRAGQVDCGALHSRTRVLLDGTPLLDETLSTVDAATLRSLAVAADAKMIAALTLAGSRDPNPPPWTMQAHGEATVWREVGATVAVTSASAKLAARWATQIRLDSSAPSATAGSTASTQPSAYYDH